MREIVRNTFNSFKLLILLLILMCEQICISRCQERDNIIAFLQW